MQPRAVLVKGLATLRRQARASEIAIILVTVALGAISGLATVVIGSLSRTLG